jgi:hypothetical protein
MGLMDSDNDPEFVIVNTADEVAAREAAEAELDTQDASDGEEPDDGV